LVEIRTVTLDIKHQKRKKKNTAVKYKPFGFAMQCGLIRPVSIFPGVSAFQVPFDTVG